jgi:hypothetical protein
MQTILIQIRIRLFTLMRIRIMLQDVKSKAQLYFAATSLLFMLMSYFHSI